MSWDGIVVNDYGQVGKITFVDVDATSTALDISTYSTISMIFIDPSNNSTTKTASFDTDGTDGVIKYTIESGLFDEAGGWHVRGRVASASAVLSTELHPFNIES